MVLAGGTSPVNLARRTCRSPPHHKLGACDRSRRVLDLTAGTAKRGEVMRANERRRPLLHRPGVERLGNVPDVCLLKWIDEACVANHITIGLGSRLQTGMKVLGRVLDLQNPDLGWQARVEPSRQNIAGMRDSDPGARDLAKGMDARIGTPCAVNRDRTALKSRQRFF